MFLISSGCPRSHIIHNQTMDSEQNILTDYCSTNDDNHWLADEGAVNDDAEIVIDMGCLKKMKGLQMKNIKKLHGGTKQFTIFLSEFHDGPWESTLVEEFEEEVTEDCGRMHIFSFRYNRLSLSLYQLYLNFSAGIIELKDDI